MPDGSPLQPELFQFTTEEMVLAPHMLDILTPEHVKNMKSQRSYIPPSNSLLSVSNSTTGETSDGLNGMMTSP